MNKVLRHALTGSAIATGMMIAASPAQAQCVVTPPATPVAGTVVCGTTATTPTVYAGVSPAVDRQYNVDTSTTAFTGTVSTGAAVTGNGLAFNNTVAGTNALNVVNNGSVASAGGGSALIVTAIGATPVVYTGEGSIDQTNVASGHGLDFFMQGTGNLTATVGVAGGAATTITTAAPNSAAIQVNRLIGTAGTTSITTTSDTTLRATLAGINIDASGAGTQTVNNAATIGSLTTALNTLANGIRVVESATGTGAIAITNSGAIGSATDRTTAFGINGQILNPASTANVTITNGAGAVFSSGIGIEASTAGTGNAVVTTGAGAVNSTGLRGVSAVSTTGQANVTVGAGGATATGASSAAVYTLTTTGSSTIVVNGALSAPTAGSAAIAANSTSGAQTITVNAAANGNRAGIYSNTGGARTITVGTAGNVTGTLQAIELLGAGATTIANNGAVGAASTDLALLNSGTGAVTFTNGSAAAPTATLNGRLTFNAGADTLTNRGVWNTQGTTDFGAGADSLVNQGGGVINLVANTTWANLETFTTNGTINFASGVTLTGPAIVFTNGVGGLIDTAGAATIAGFTSMQNNGTIELAAGTFTAPAGIFSNNASGIVVADEGATTITGQTSFTNNGILDLQDGAIGDTLTINSAYSGLGRLQVDVSGNTADTLVLTGTADGLTLIDVNTIGLGVFDVDGILVVDAAGASSGAFDIGEESGNPLINYDVEQIGNDYFLVTLLDPETAFVPLAATGLLREMWYQSADEVFSQTLAPTLIEGFTVWGQVYGSQRRTGSTNNQVVNGVQYDADNNIEIDRYGVQAGVGYGWGLAEVGLTGGYADAQADGDGQFEADGWNIGLYGKYGGLTGFHAEALFKHDAYDVEFDGLFDGNDIDASSTGIDGSIGYRLPLGVVPSIDIHAGLSHVWSDMDGVSAFGFDYDFDDMTSTRGRLGVRGNFGGLYNPYLGATGYHEFSGDGDVTITQGLFSDSLSSTGKATWVRLEGGLNGELGTYGLHVAGWVDLGDVRGAGIRAGYRWGASRAMVEPAYIQPAPPPPPAEAPPATQTCADGSVILATEACPPPPPPPAPGERGL